jgi:uncharacterized repeat protein (TIGR01451 family)
VSLGSYAPGTGTWSLGTLGTGLSATLLLGATAAPGTAASTLVNVANLAALVQTDTVATNNAASRSVTVRGADLDLTLSANSPAPNAGDTLTYTIALSNAGPIPATGVAVTDRLPAGLTWRAQSASQGAWSLATASGASARSPTAPARRSRSAQR